MPADLRAALAMPTTFGPKLFEITALLAVAAACTVKVKDAGDLLLLRHCLFEELGPPYMWVVMLSVVEWEHLTTIKRTCIVRCATRGFPECVVYWYSIQ
jgi:hypothetical protein